MRIRGGVFSNFAVRCTAIAVAAITAAAGIAFLTRSSPQALSSGESITIDKGNCTVENEPRTYTRSEIRTGTSVVTGLGFSWGSTYYESYYGNSTKNPNYVINFYRKSGDTGYASPFYCIQNGVHVNSTSRTVRNPEDDAYWNSLSADARQGIKLALLYGYPNDTLGGAMCDAYVATQVLIWEFAEGCIGLDGTYYASPKHKHPESMMPDCLSGAVQRPQGNSSDWFVKNVLIKDGGDKSNYKTPAYYCHEKLVEKVKNAMKKPSFDGAEITLQYDKATKTYKGTLTDTAGQLANFTVKNANGLTVSVSGNELSISSTSSLYGRTVEIELGKGTSGSSAQKVVVLANGSEEQEMITGSDPVSVVSKVKVTSVPSSGYIQVHKGYEASSSEALTGTYSVAGAQYGVYGSAACTGTPLATLTVGLNGYSNIAEIDGIDGGSKKVWVKELSVPTQSAASFEWSLDAVREATVTTDSSEDNPVVVNSTDKITEYGWFRMQKKTDSGYLGITQGNSLYSVVGTEYAVYSGDGTYKGTFVTKAGGLTDAVKVPVGSYYAVETKAPAGHMLRTERILFSVLRMSGPSEALVVEQENPAVHDPMPVQLDKDWSAK